MQKKKFVSGHTPLKFECPSLNVLSLTLKVKQILLSKSAKLSNYTRKAVPSISFCKTGDQMSSSKLNN